MLPDFTKYILPPDTRIFVEACEYYGAAEPPICQSSVTSPGIISMEGLANIIRFRFHLDPYDRNTLFLFCGKRTDRIKGDSCGREMASCYYTNG